ncbi:MAG: nucleotidyltransferase domain-containing protein [Elusimicrobiota bacterium]
MNKNIRKMKLEVELKRIVEILCAKYFPKELILFGSLVKGKIRENSDIDLVIIKQTNKKFTERIGEVIELCKPKMAVDFIVYTPKEFANLKEREPFIRKEIVENGKLIYEKYQ